MKKIAIVIEDEPSTREYFEMMLESLGYEVETYPSPVLCPLYKEDYKCDLLLTDNSMPSMTGLEFIRHLHKKNRTVPMTALVTGSWEEHLKNESGKLGFKVFRKPLEFDVISDWLNSC